MMKFFLRSNIIYSILSLLENHTSATNHRHLIWLFTTAIFAISLKYSFFVFTDFLLSFPVFLSLYFSVFWIGWKDTGRIISLLLYNKLRIFTPLTFLPKVWSKCQVIKSFSSVYGFSSIVSSTIKTPSSVSISRIVGFTSFHS